MSEMLPISRRKFLSLSPLLIGVPLVASAPLWQGHSEGLNHLDKYRESVVRGLVMGILEEDLSQWKVSLNEIVLAWDKVVDLIPQAKREELTLILSLLSYAPSCYFLTGSLSPWKDSVAVKRIIKKWQLGKIEIDRVLYGAFCEITYAALYQDPRAGAFTGYPGPPEI